jgi:hypothetical protein
MYGFGRIPSPEDKRDYRMAAAVPYLEAVKRADKIWYSGRTLNQGDTPHCVGFSWAGWGISLPVQDDFTDATGHQIYAACKKIDGHPLASGSSIRAGAKVMKAAGRIGTYFFSYDVAEAADYVSKYGPVVLGTNWYYGMNTPNPTTFEIVPTGRIVGGHAYLWLGVKGHFAIIRNAWGTGWGNHGNAKISLSNLAKLLADRGEACAATEKPLPIGGN